MPSISPPRCTSFLLLFFHFFDVLLDSGLVNCDFAVCEAFELPGLDAEEVGPDWESATYAVAESSGSLNTSPSSSVAGSTSSVSIVLS